MSEIRIIIGGGHPDRMLPVQKGAEEFKFKVMHVGAANAVVMMATSLYDDPKWLGYDTSNHRAIAILNIRKGERLKITYPCGQWTYTGYKNLDDTITLEWGNATELKTYAVKPEFKEYLGEANALEVIMHPAGEDGAEQIYLFSNQTMTSPGYDDMLYLCIPKEMRAVTGEIIALRYPFEANAIILRRDGATLAKLNEKNPTFREGRMEYRFIPYYTISEDMRVITIRQVDTDFKTRFVKETEVIVDDSIESPYADEYASWCFRVGVSVQKQTKNYRDLAEYFLCRAKDAQ